MYSLCSPAEALQITDTNTISTLAASNSVTHEVETDTAIDLKAYSVHFKPARPREGGADVPFIPRFAAQIPIYLILASEKAENYLLDRTALPISIDQLNSEQYQQRRIERQYVWKTAEEVKKTNEVNDNVSAFTPKQ